MNDTTNMIVAVIVVGLLAAASIRMLFVTPIVVRSNLPDVIGGDDDDFLTGGEGAQKDSSAVEEKIQSQTMMKLKETLKRQIVRTSSAE